MRKREKGITLISLIITIIILAIILGISINLLIAEDSPLGEKAKVATENTGIEAAREQIAVEIADIMLDLQRTVVVQDLISIGMANPEGLTIKNEYVFELIDTLSRNRNNIYWKRSRDRYYRCNRGRLRQLKRKNYFRSYTSYCRHG